ncbi:MAG: hypothetical protein ABS939_00145 [Psychrobacillus sp.]
MTPAVLENNKLLIEKELKNALILFSKNLLSEQRAKSIAKSTLDGIDIEHPILAHKGVNWLAQEILKTIKF